MKELLLPLLMLVIGYLAGSRWGARADLEERWRSGYEMGREVGAAEQGRQTAAVVTEAEDDAKPTGLTDQDRQQRWSDRFDNEAAIRESVTEEERAAAVRRAQENEEHWRLLEATRSR